MKVYSYLRFSAAKQATGASIARQTEYAERWAADHGMALDDTLSMRDEGLSAYHQQHVKSGALGIFLAAIDAGKIPIGSVLIVESLDRLSRAAPLVAQGQLSQIINGGVTVITTIDGKQYNRENIAANPMDLIFSLLTMIRANEESEVKSKRVSDALRRRCEGWVAGTYRGRIACGSDPSWVAWNGSAWELVPDMAETIRLAIQLFVGGYGARRILTEILARGLRITGGDGGVGNAGNITQLLRGQPHLFAGDRIVEIGGAEYLLKGYYPALLSPEEYSGLVVALAKRKSMPRANGGKSPYPGIVTGLGITTCGHCGSGIFSRNQKRSPRADGALLYRRLVCLKCEAERKSGSCNSEAVESAIMQYCSDQINLESLAGSTDNSAPIRAERAAIELSIADLERRLGKMVDAALASPDGLPQIVITRMRDTEKEIAQARAREQQLTAELSLASAYDLPAAAAVWADLRKGVTDLDYNARTKCRKLMSETFSAIQIYPRGIPPEVPGGSVDIVLVSKAGSRRWLRVNKSTGGFMGGLNFNQHGG